DQRFVTDSGGHREKRYVIETTVVLGDTAWPIELTLTDRDTMRFRMLLGRTALHRRFIVNPATSYVIGKPKRQSRQTTNRS
ncbi:MAG: RimK/LysX family protein, partial [Gammaproteobacteria bacterium]|nr:RimK/LysX family protein [Gammaproteobacteria bacterium]